MSTDGGGIRPDPGRSVGSGVARVLRETWGYDQLRPLQGEAIAANLAGRDVLLVMPTGGGKSLTFQLPEILSGGLTVVVSPLIALMKDQVDGLRADGVAAAALHSQLDEPTRNRVRMAVRGGEIRLLYLSPELLVSRSVHDLLRDVGVRTFAIDEAHCISHWGHDFRPEYRRLAGLREDFPDATFHACTATATPQVRHDIVSQLGLRNPEVLVGEFDRPNLTLRIRRRDGGRDQIVEEVRRHDGCGVIVYALSRKETEAIAAKIREKGLNAAFYHAGMSPEERERVQSRFAREEINIVVATVAFGMGIDRSNIRAVIHAAMPRSIEHYQQETGRAGRDGEPAECVLFHSYADVDRWRALARQSFEEAVRLGGDSDALRESFRAQEELLQDMNRLATGMRCRHRAIVTYFGGGYPDAACGACDVCLGEIEVLSDSTELARKILSGVARVNQGFGVGHVAEVLCGGESQAILRWRHHELSTWGLLREHSRKDVVHLIYQLIDHGVLARTTDERPVVVLTERSNAVLRGEREIRLMKPPVSRGFRRRTAAHQASEAGVDPELFEALRQRRAALARAQSVPAYVIFSDRTLKELARQRPTSLAGMHEVHGVGEAKLKKYGEAFLEIIVGQ